MTQLRNLLLIAGLITVLHSCSDSDSEPNKQAGDVVSYNLKTTVWAASAKTIAEIAGYDQFEQLINYDADVYELIYLTEFKGELIRASALVSVPIGDEPFPILNANHGTIFANDEAPTSSTVSIEMLLGTTGYITVIPDFIGYGISKRFLHPYYVKEYEAGAVLDAINAANEMVESLEINLSDKLFLFGYSEGGYVTMAVQRALEFDKELQNKITASAIGAGGYDINDVMSNILAKEEYFAPGYLAFVVHAYNTTYDWDIPLDEIFNEPYASEIPELFNGDYHFDQVNASLTNSIADLFNPEFLEDMKNQRHPLYDPAFKENSLLDWAPQSPTRLFHGTEDGVVPFENSELTFQTLQKNGAADLEFIIRYGGTHGTTITPMIEYVIPWFESLK